MSDMDQMNMDNEWLVGVLRDGQGYHYTATCTGVLWASGWVRCDDSEVARRFAWETGQRAAGGML